jgi:hypothetical protein
VCAKLYNLPEFEILVKQGSHERALNETETMAVLWATDIRPTLCCEGCHKAIHPAKLCNLSWRFTDSALVICCAACAERVADTFQVPTDGTPRWYRLTDTINLSLRGFEECRGRVIEHNRRFTANIRARIRQSVGSITVLQPTGGIRNDTRRAKPARTAGNRNEPPSSFSHG